MDDIDKSILFGSNGDWDSVLREIAGACTQSFFYAISVIVFIIAICNLYRRRTGGKKVLLTFSWTMATLGTTQFILSILTMVETLRVVQQLVKQAIDLTPNPPPPETYDFLYTARAVVFSTNKSVHHFIGSVVVLD
ncbi:hypothetical protein B0H14DRAFT_3532397 [Mycena olivaceomarginata]|nr:hypothetical protein B0H14DRAFT_3532397 [Mycena olivaceomarginata]